MQRVWGWAENGNQLVQTNGLNSSTKVQRSFPSATVTVYVAGSNNLATLYSDNNGTPLANPFTASNSGYWDFYAGAGRYDVQFSGNNAGIPSPFTLPDILSGAIQNINNQTGESQTLVVGTSGNNFNIVSANNVHTFNLPRASANNNGYLAASDWSKFNNASSYNFNSPLFTANNNNVYIITPLPINFGGSNANNATQAFTNLSPITTTGDLIVGNNNAVPVRLPVGNNNLVLVADANNGSGLKWGQVDLTVGILGILPIANGGSNANNATQAFTNLSPITTKGDLIAGNNNNIPVRLPIGANNQSLIADSSNNNGMRWGQVNLTSGVTGILPLANGGTNGNNATQGFTNLSPITTQGDIIQGNATGVPVRLPVGNNNQILAANNNNVGWITPTYRTAKFTVASNNNNFVVNSNATDVQLFTLGQYEKIAGATVKPSALFLNANNTITDVQVSLGVGGNSNLFTSLYSVGNNGAVGNSNFQDTSLFKSGNMGANQAILAHFVASNNNFGNGVSTVLTGGSVDIWVIIATLQ